jgi:aspartate/methionine/tyrosine aminotransferase
MRATLADDAHVAAQKDLYRQRRAVLVPALEAAGFTVSGSVAGLYLWVSNGTPTWDTIGMLAGLGILAGPGVFYGDAGNGFVRIALTGSDERVDAAVARLADAPR